MQTRPSLVLVFPSDAGWYSPSNACAQVTRTEGGVTTLPLAV